jgi:aldehyde dehydrogenase
MDQTLEQDAVLTVKGRGLPHASRDAVRAGAAILERGDGFPGVSAPVGRYGMFADVDHAVAAAAAAQRELVALSLEDRDAIVTLIKSMAMDNAAMWGAMELEETGIGRLEHKIEKLQAVHRVPGVEWLRTNAMSGSHGLGLEEFAPFGLIGVVTPRTHSVPTLSANAINMIAAGNAMVCSPHPGAARCAAHAAREYNRAIARRFGIEDLITVIVAPTRDTVRAVFDHAEIALLVVTGGSGVAGAALEARKRAIVAGPGNPPVVVDETACLEIAARSIVKGAGYDNNLLCIGEKQVFCVESVFDELLGEMERAGSRVLSAAQIDALSRRVFVETEGRARVNRDYVGQSAATLAEAAGVRVPLATPLIIGETGFEHAFVQTEQMMPFVPFVRVRDVDEAIDLAVRSEHGFHHTAVVHSQNLDHITRFGHAIGVTLLVANGPSLAGLGLGGPGYLSYSIATPTGEGITNPLTFTRCRRVMMTDSLRMI